jgi:hypothetical protein
MNKSMSLKQKGLQATSEELAATLDRASSAYIEGALSNPNIYEDHIIILLKNQSLTPNIFDRIGKEKRWRKHYKIKLGIVSHPRAPKHLSMQFIRFLFWKDLMIVADNYKLPPPLRRLAEELIRNNYDSMAEGEKITLARIASRPVIRSLRESKNPRVVEALLKNWRITEEDISTIARSEKTNPETLSAIARDEKWNKRFQIKMAIIKNKNSPIHYSLKSLEGLLKRDLKKIKKDATIRKIVRVRAERELEKHGRTKF